MENSNSSTLEYRRSASDSLMATLDIELPVLS